MNMIVALIQALGKSLIEAAESGDFNIKMLSKGLIEAAESGALGAPRVIYDRLGISRYLSRFYILGCPTMADGSSPFNAEGNPKENAVFPKGLGVYVHRFHRSDEDAALHSHPWRWCVSLILRGGYREERMYSEVADAVVEGFGWKPHLVRRVEVLDYGPGDINVLTSETFHRVDLKESDAWSLFITGPKTKTWSFWERETGVTTHWRDFIEGKRGKPL